MSNLSKNYVNISRLFFAIIFSLLFSSQTLANGKKIYYPPPSGMSLSDGAPKHALALEASGNVHPQYLRQVVPFKTKERAGTIIVKTDEKFLYLVLNNGYAMRYGVGVGRDGFTWSGVHKITAKRKWPSWTPPAEMRKRQPELPAFMPGGIDNPLGARALYIGSTLYRLHGTKEIWSIGKNVSSGCIRLLNHDVIDLYNRVRIGAKIIVM